MTVISKRIPLGAALVLALVAFGCQESARSDVPTTPPAGRSPSTPSPQVPPEKIIPIHLGGVFVLPETTIRIVEGTRVTIHAATDRAGRDFTGGGESEGIPVRARHDAPPDQVTAGGDVRVGGSNAPGVVHIRALADDAEEPDATYSLWLEEIPGTQPDGGFVLQVDPTPLRFEVVDAVPASCGEVRIHARARGAGGAAGEFAAGIFGEEVQEYRVADLTLQIPDPGLEISLAAPYRTPFEHLEDDAETSRYTAMPMGFALDSRLREAGEVLVQSLSLAHFGPLHLLAQSPGCDGVEVLCKDGHCDVQQGPANSH